MFCIPLSTNTHSSLPASSDIIQHTVYALIPDENKTMLHRNIGTSLLQHADNKPAIHLLAVDQLNSSLTTNGASLTPEERSRFAEANVNAAKFAIQACSFEQGKVELISLNYFICLHPCLSLHPNGSQLGRTSTQE